MTMACNGGGLLKSPAKGRGPLDAGAVVIGGDYRGLTVVRSLGRRGIPVWVLVDEQSIAAASRYALCKKPWPGAESEAHQVQYLLDLAARHNLKGWTVIPTSDEHAALLARHQSDLRGAFRIAASPWETLRWAYDKRLSHRLAQRLGMAHPRTWYPRSRDELAALMCDFPVILKPAIKAAANPFTEAKAWKVNGRGELLARYEEAAGLVDPSIIMVQELIPGGGESQFSYGALCADGRALGSVVARRCRQYPIDFGRSSSYVETIAQPEVEAMAQRLLGELRYTGLIEIEFKYDRRDGRYKLLDLNPRIWGWNSLSKPAGVDFPYLFWRLCQGREVAPVRARPDVRWMRMTTDLPAAIAEAARGRLSLAAYLRSFRRPLEFGVFAKDDLLPCLLEVPLLSIAKWKRRSRLATAAPTGRSCSAKLREQVQ
jgi:predicted ATP-grasp superfamily ATP-dependent carboligase